MLDCSEEGSRDLGPEEAARSAVDVHFMVGGVGAHGWSYSVALWVVLDAWVLGMGDVADLAPTQSENGSPRIGQRMTLWVCKALVMREGKLDLPGGPHLCYILILIRT